MKVTSVRIFPVRNRERLRALADVVFDGGFIVTDLRIVEKNDGGLTVCYPVSQFASSNVNRYVCNPINPETQQGIEQAILNEYQRYINHKSAE